MSTLTARSDIDRWEAVFEPDLAAASRHDCPEPWLTGHIHVARDLPAQPEPVQTGLLDGHAVLVFDTVMHHARESFAGRPPHYDGLVRPGDAWVYPAVVQEDEHWTSWSAGGSFTSVMLPSATVAQATQALDRDYAALEFRERYGHRDAVLSALVRQLGREMEAGAPNGRLYAEQLMQTVAVHLVAKHTAGAPKLNPPSGGLPGFRLQRVKDYIEVHLAQEIRLEDLADEAGMNLFYFSRLFKQSTGEPPYQYVIRRRVEEARRLLKAHPEWNIYQVALAVGYDSHSRFSQLFKRETGLTPSEYRRQCRR